MAGDEVVVTTGLVLQELLQGFTGPKDQLQIIERFAALRLIQPNRDDRIAAAGIHNACRRSGVQLATINALLIQFPLSALKKQKGQTLLA